MLKVNVEDIMSYDLVKIEETATIAQAAHILLRFRINGILVVKKKEQNDLVGVLTTTDLLQFMDIALSERGRRIDVLKKFAQMRLKDVSTKKHIIKVQKDTKIERVIAIMHKKNLHTIPVYDGEELVGVVGKHDILNVVFG